MLDRSTLQRWAYSRVAFLPMLAVSTRRSVFTGNDDNINVIGGDRYYPTREQASIEYCALILAVRVCLLRGSLVTPLGRCRKTALKSSLIVADAGHQGGFEPLRTSSTCTRLTTSGRLNQSGLVP